jgi:hypothetical protein
VAHTMAPSIYDNSSWGKFTVASANRVDTWRRLLWVFEKPKRLSKLSLQLGSADRAKLKRRS